MDFSMEYLNLFILNHIDYAPYLIFGLLMLAGLNIPISEDAMIFTTAILAIKHPDHLVPLLLGLYLGAYLSDILCYGLGRFFGPKLWKIKHFSKIASPAKVHKIQSYFEKHGLIIFVLLRFVPFGVRNGLILTSGIIKMPLMRFVSVDFVACSTVVFTYFTLYYRYGRSIISTVQKFNEVFIILFLFGACFFIYRYLNHIKN
jgi:membrane protein DedA with SNARE-associated domain